MGLNIGCDTCKIDGMHNIDIRPEVHPDIVMDIKNLAYPDCSFTEINMGNLLEHLSREDIIRGLNECRRVLVPNGVAYITSPLVDLALSCFQRGLIDEDKFQSIIKGEGEGFNSHKIELRSGDLEQMLFETGFRCEPLNLNTFPYLVVSDMSDPKPDPWMGGIKATKYRIIGPH